MAEAGLEKRVAGLIETALSMFPGMVAQESLEEADSKA